MTIEHQNPEQDAYWNEQAGPQWVRFQDVLDGMLHPLGEAALDALAPVDGEHALDVGCGCGHTSLALARRVAPHGSVTGIDLSAPMLERARERAAEEGLAGTTFLQADAQTHAFPRGSLDLLYSRFGVMFFSDPVGAFRNMRPALREEGRLAFVCWQAAMDNAWLMTTVTVAMKYITLDPPDPEAPGPFAFANADRVRNILAQSGFADVAVDGLRSKIVIGAGRPTEETVAFLVRLGPVGRLIAAGEIDEATIEKIKDDLGAALEPFVTDDGIVMDASNWIVTGRAA
jgi:SAM-dependent methyltransferase